MAAIDIGAAATVRSAGTGISDYTMVGVENPANDTGAITSCEIYLYSKIGVVDVWAGTFSASGDVLTCRDSESLGDVATGSKQTISGLDITVVTGDYLGAHDKSANTANIYYDSSGDGRWYFEGECIDASDSETFTLSADRTLSLYGEGETAVTEKSSSDTGSGVDAYVSLETQQDKSSSDTGAGADAKASGNPIATLVKAETGSGVDAVDSLQTPEAKSSSDAGSGAEGTPVQSAILAGSESGSGIEAIIARLLAALDTGDGAEASSLETEGQLKDLFASELGEGADRLVARIEMPTKGGGMKLWT